jgi:hypothetical protein
LYGINNSRIESSPNVTNRKPLMKTAAVPTLFGNQERFFEFEEEKEMRA